MGQEGWEFKVILKAKASPRSGSLSQKERKEGRKGGFSSFNLLLTPTRLGERLSHKIRKRATEDNTVYLPPASSTAHTQTCTHKEGPTRWSFRVEWFAAKPGRPDSLPGTHKWGLRSSSPNLSSDLHIHTCAQPTAPHTSINTGSQILRHSIGSRARPARGRFLVWTWLLRQTESPVSYYFWLPTAQQRVL